MRYLNGIIAMLALALSSAALAGMVYTDAYTLAAQAEASGYRALTRQVTGDTLLLCEQTPARSRQQ